MCVVRGVFVCVNGDDVRCVLREREALSIALSTLVMYVALLLLLLFFIMSNALACIRNSRWPPSAVDLGSGFRGF